MELNINGKVDRAALSASYEADAAAGPGSGDLSPSQPAWQTPWESALGGIWQALLPHATLSASAHFLTIGGTSILALRVAAEVRRMLGRDLRPVDVLLYPVLADQAAYIAALPALPMAEARSESTPDEAGGPRHFGDLQFVNVSGKASHRGGRRRRHGPPVRHWRESASASPSPLIHTTSAKTK